MPPKIRIDGVYDVSTFTHLSNMEVENFLFDCRPLSYQFIQQHCLNELIKDNQRPFQNYYLKFSDEKDFVVRKLLNDLNETISNGPQEKKSVILEFSGDEQSRYMDSFKTPYFKEINQQTYLRPYMSSLFLQGFVFPFSFFSELKENGGLESFKEQFDDEIKLAQIIQAPKLILKIEWDDDIFGSLFDLFDFDAVSFPINANVESAYRQVNLEKTEQEIRFFIDNGLVGRVNKHF